MSDLAPLRAALAATDLGEAGRIDGWTGPRRRAFLEAVAEGHPVEAACRFVGLSVASAYALRRRAGGEAFALGWRAAGLLARERLADRLTSRAIDGQLDTYTRADGQEVTRHRYDNALAMRLLSRLDRQAEGAGWASDPAIAPGARAEPAKAAPRPSPDDPAVVARIVADDFPAFLDGVAADGGAAEARAFVEAALVRLFPQLPQLRGDAGEGPASDAPYWWEDGEWRTALPPPLDFHGEEEGCYGEPHYNRSLTTDEEDIAEALNGGRPE